MIIYKMLSPLKQSNKQGIAYEWLYHELANTFA